jgi:hypothetical protein
MLPLVLSSCTSPCVSDSLHVRFTDSPYVRITMDAIHKFYEMKESGKLPGISEDVHGDLQTGAIPQSGPVIYPASVTLGVTTASNHEHFCYLFMKDTKISEWRLARASRMLPDGKFEDLKIQ